MNRDLRDALAIDRAVRGRAATEATPLADGLVIRRPDLGDVHYLNALILEAEPLTLDATDVAALADRWLGDLHHRHVVIDDAAAGERLAATLLDSGWTLRRTTFMAFRGDPAAGLPDPRARTVSESEMKALQRAGLEEEVSSGDPRSGLVGHLLAAQTALRAATPARCFGAVEDGGLRSMCTLFLDADVNGRRVAMVEEVGTLTAYRGRGLARAVVTAAVASAAAWDAELIVVPVDADDWPQLMYAGLGFEPIGRQVSLTARPGSVSAAV